MKKFRTILTLLLAVACLGMTACHSVEPEPDLTEPVRSTDPIMSVPKTEPTMSVPETEPTKPEAYHPTPVYVTMADGIAYIATQPVSVSAEVWEKEPCAPKSISEGGQIVCCAEHYDEAPITTVIITETVCPQSTRDWFRDLSELTQIQGLELLDMTFVTDSRDMFTGCRYQIPEWFEVY